jgi:sugar O-acyltransferase (sialic acid O-acetyltransferase NeuD family)
MKPLILIGGGGHCKSCIEVIESTKLYEIKGIIDLPENFGKTLMGYQIIGSDQDIKTHVNVENLFLITIGCIGDFTKRIQMFEMVTSLGGKLATIIAPTAYVSKSAKMGEGTIVMHQAFINTSTVIGYNCIINTKALIEHDATIGNHCHISTGSVVNGGTIVGEKCFFGSGAVSKQYISIPDGSFIKANSIVK